MVKGGGGGLISHSYLIEFAEKQSVLHIFLELFIFLHLCKMSNADDASPCLAKQERIPSLALILLDFFLMVSAFQKMSLANACVCLRQG